MSMMQPELSLQDEVERCDPPGRELLSVAATLFKQEQFARFRDGVDACYDRASECSPTAILLIGCSYHNEGEYDMALKFVEKSRTRWKAFAELGVISQRCMTAIDDTINEHLVEIETARQTPNTPHRVLLPRATV